VLQQGRRRRFRFVDIAWVQAEAGHARLGLIVPKFQSTAVARNRLRRRLREIWRRQVAPGLAGIEAVVRARREAYQASFSELQRDLERWGSALGPGRG
jgi:ribonuclease P protein component